MKHYLESAEDVLIHVASSPDGLRQQAAEERLEKNGKNRLEEAKGKSLIRRILEQLADPMILVLLAAAAVSAVTAYMSNESFADVFIILCVVVINAVLGVVQESKAEKAIDALKEMAAATSKVYRDGKLQVLKSEDLVVGDVIVLEAGDAVPADARLLESHSLKAEESALTGESVPVNKITEAIAADSGTVPLGDRLNMVYSGSTVVYGRGTAVITATGMDTEMGKIARAITSAADGQTPLQHKLAQLSKILTVLVLCICVFIFAFSLLRKGWGDFSALGLNDVLDTFILAVSLAVAAIPEGLATVVTIVLSMGVTKMSKRNAVIRKLTAVETLGCTQVVCSDKTGTLTQNKMTVVKHFGTDEAMLATGMALCSDAYLNREGAAEGEPTECALVNYAYSLKLPKQELEAKAPRVGELPFDSGRKMMTTLHTAGQDRILQYTKGAPDVVLARCTHYWEQGKSLPMTDEKRQEIEAANKSMADEALRVLALACKVHPSLPEKQDSNTLEKDLVFVGLTGMIDPVRPEVYEAIQKCLSAGVRPIMITGDHLDTAVAIAKELGIIRSAKEAITGAMLDELSDQQLAQHIADYSVYARVQPEHKVRIVKAWQSKGMVTAMTGDGVNDAPSIKNADIGIGMGITGTDVTKNVADMVLADDNFATIVLAVEEGRKIYDNIRKSIQFLLASNLSEVLSIFVATMLGFTILKPVHLLWINLITDTFPALSLGVEKGEADIMKRKPRDKSDGIFAGGMAFDVIYQGILSMLFVVVSYLVGHYMEVGKWEFVTSEHGMTMAFLTLSLLEIFHTLNMRSQRGSIFTIKTQNLMLWGAMGVSFLLTTAVIYVPFLAELFRFEHISAREYAVAVGLAFLIIPTVETVKLIQRTVAAKKKKAAAVQ